MNSNIIEIASLISSLKTKKDIESFFCEIFTEEELFNLSKRWRILIDLAEGKTQREIAKDHNVSLCKITRGSKILKNKNSITSQYLNKGKEDENNGKN